MEALSAVFREEARLCVILHREGWGGATFTRIEADAIKARGFADGWDHVLVVRLDNARLPDWVQPQGLLDKAARIAREHAFERERRAFLHSEAAVSEASKEALSVLAAISKKATALQRVPGVPDVAIDREQRDAIRVST